MCIKKISLYINHQIHTMYCYRKLVLQPVPPNHLTLKNVQRWMGKNLDQSIYKSCAVNGFSNPMTTFILVNNNNMNNK